MLVFLILGIIEFIIGIVLSKRNKREWAITFITGGLIMINMSLFALIFFKYYPYEYFM